MNDIPTPNAAHLTPIIPQPKPAGIGRNADLTPHLPAPSPSATPRTDAVQTKAEHEDYDVELAMIVSHARQLERELAELKAEQDTPSGVHSCHQSCQRPMCVLRRERDNALSDWRQADTDCIRAIHERNEEREKARRLAMFVGELLAAVRINAIYGTFAQATQDQIEAWVKERAERLAEIAPTD
jgi:hypothetical protein